MSDPECLCDGDESSFKTWFLSSSRDVMREKRGVNKEVPLMEGQPDGEAATSTCRIRCSDLDGLWSSLMGCVCARTETDHKAPSLHMAQLSLMPCLAGGHVNSGLGHKPVGAASSGRVSPAVRHNGEERWGDRGGPVQPGDPALIAKFPVVPEESTVPHK